MKSSIEDVKKFWDENPLFTGESKYPAGTKEFFEEHKQVYYNDVFNRKRPGNLFIPKLKPGARVLDLGCGVGFWVIEILKDNPQCEMHAADLTETALEITRKRLETYSLKASLSLQNAESMTYPDNFFDHVNCQGVIHHTPGTEQAVKEIARVLKPGGTASLSVYYRNLLLRNWRLFKPFGKLVYFLGARFKGRGRENIFLVDEADEITRLYDGSENPVGKSYSKKEMMNMVKPWFEVENIFLNFFPARTLPFKIPGGLQDLLSRKMGFLIHMNIRKK